MRASKVFLVRLAAASLGAAGLWFAWPQNQPAPAALELQKVTANLYVLIGDGGNVAFISTATTREATRPFWRPMPKS
jgi:hypothetical protein